MKNIKTYNNYINESLKDKIKGKTNEELIKSLENLSDSTKIKLIIKYNLSYDLLPDNSIIEGNLYYKNNKLSNLPDNLTINGYLDCSYNNQLTQLPDNLTVNGSLNCNSTELTQLPNNLTVGGNLYCNNNQLTQLPNNLIVGGDLYCKRNKLPNNIEKPKGVKGVLYK